MTSDSADGSGARAVAIEGDGKIVAAGGAATGGGSFALARYNPDGTLAPSFGTGGKVTTDFAGDYDVIYAMGIQGDGKIVAAGAEGYGPFALARYQGAPGPAITSVSPASVGQGGTVLASIRGSNFQPGAAVSVSGSDASIVSTTLVDATKLKAQIIVSPSAQLGVRDVTVTDPGGRATCLGCPVIDAGPTPTSPSPTLVFMTPPST